MPASSHQLHTHTPIRDINNTIMYSGVIEAARVASHNVFVKDLKDSSGNGRVVWNTRVRFHCFPPPPPTRVHVIGLWSHGVMDHLRFFAIFSKYRGIITQFALVKIF